MFVAAHICFDRQIASHGRSEESKHCIQGGLRHLCRKLTAIRGSGPDCRSPVAGCNRSCCHSPGLHPESPQRTRCPRPAPACGRGDPEGAHFTSRQADRTGAALILHARKVQHATAMLQKRTPQRGVAGPAWDAPSQTSQHGDAEAGGCHPNRAPPGQGPQPRTAGCRR